MKNKLPAVLLSSFAAVSALLPCSLSVSAETAYITAGNIEKSSYVVVLVVAGVLAIAAVIAGIFTKKKK